MAIRILLADDNDQFRAVIRQFLGEEVPDLQVVAEVGDGTAAVQQAQVLKAARWSPTRCLVQPRVRSRAPLSNDAMAGHSCHDLR